jgi:hypothetical protein
MWALVQKEAKNSKAPLDMNVCGQRVEADVEGGARRSSRTWQPSTDGNIHDDDNSVDSHLKGLIEKVVQAGSWAVLMEVYTQSSFKRNGNKRNEYLGVRKKRSRASTHFWG